MITYFADDTPVKPKQEQDRGGSSAHKVSMVHACSVPYASPALLTLAHLQGRKSLLQVTEGQRPHQMAFLSNKLLWQRNPRCQLTLALHQAFKQRLMMEATLWLPFSDTGLQLTLPQQHATPFHT